MTGTAFISYASPDRDWAEWLDGLLQAAGFKVTIDFRDFGGNPSVHDMSVAIDSADHFVPVFSAAYFEPGRWTVDESAAAYHRWKNKRIAVSAVLVSEVDEVPALLSQLPRVDIHGRIEAAAVKIITADLEKYYGKIEQELSPNRRFPGPLPQSAGRMRLPVTARAIDVAHEDALYLIDIQEPVGHRQLQQLQESIRAIARSYNFMSPAEVLREVQTLFARSKQLSENSKSSGAMVDAYLCLGQLAGLRAYALLDLGYNGEALTQAIAVDRAGALCGSVDLRAWSIGTQAMIYRFEEHFDRSITTVNDFLQDSIPSPVHLARLHAQNLLGYSEIGDETESLKSLSLSEAMIDGGASKELDFGIFTFPRSKMHYYAGTGLMALSADHAERGIDESRRAIELFSTSSSIDEKSKSDELLAYVHLAGGLLKTKSYDEIPETLEPLFSADVPLRTAWHLQWLQRLNRSLSESPGGPPSVAAEIAAKVSQFVSELPSADGTGL